MSISNPQPHSIKSVSLGRAQALVCLKAPQIVWTCFLLDFKYHFHVEFSYLASQAGLWVLHAFWSKFCSHITFLPPPPFPSSSPTPIPFTLPLLISPFPHYTHMYTHTPIYTHTTLHTSQQNKNPSEPIWVVTVSCVRAIFSITLWVSRSRYLPLPCGAPGSI